MQEIYEKRDRQIHEFTENYMGKLFYFCLKKTGSTADAEDLTQDIALNILTALNKGTFPGNFPAWVWQIARNRYSVWASEKHIRRESVTGSDIGDYAIEDENGSIPDRLIRCEQLSQLRRELAFIRSEYRDIVVAYYIENKRIREIALSLSLSESAVQQRLHRARIILKEGMDMAREFGKRSYHPEQVAFVMNGRDGKNGQPWSIISRLLYKNIFLETYEKPQTAQELALELGIALPYMEDDLEYLAREQLLRKEGKRYQTNFPIVSKEEQWEVHEANKKMQKPLTDGICALIDTYIREDAAKVNFGYIGYEAAKWALLVQTFDALFYAGKKHKTEAESHAPYPARPDDGAWTLTGYERIDWEKPAFVGQHGYLTYDVHEVKREIDFGQYKFFYKNIQEKTPMHITWKEAYTLWLVCSTRTEACESSYLEKLMQYGYLRKDASRICPNVVIFDRNAEAVCRKESADRLSALRAEIDRLLEQVPDMERGYIVEQALTDGWLQYDSDTIPTVGAYIYI